MAGVGDQEGNRTALVADPWAKDFRGGRPGAGGGWGGTSLDTNGGGKSSH